MVKQYEIMLIFLIVSYCMEKGGKINLRMLKSVWESLIPKRC